MDEVPGETVGEKDEPRPTYYVTLRFGRIKLRGTFETRDDSLKPGDWVMARTPRGVEPGLVLSLLRTVPTPPGTKEGEEDQVSGEVLRKLKPVEVKAPWSVSGRYTREYRIAMEKIRELNLPMKLTDVEVFPRRDKAVFYFLAEGRIDFRQLVKNLAKALRLRVEMKQIGVRDEARLKGTCGHCGLPLCCASWIRKMEPVNMKMAKSQKTTLDPDKISGRCGRLLCCLRYEEHIYNENKKRLPPKNMVVETPEGLGKVMDHNILMCQVKVAMEAGEHKVFPAHAVRPARNQDIDIKS